MSKERFPTTNAVRVLRDHNVAFTHHPYDYEERGGTAVSARELGVDEHAVIKTLVLEDDAKRPFVMLMHGDREVSMKTLARLLGVVLGLNNGTGLIMTAFAGTGVIFFGMAAMSSVVKRDLSQMGKFLFIGMVMLLVAMIANFFIQSSALMITLSVLAIGIFSLFILHDLKRVQDGLETNYISATLGVYLSIYNVFSNLLALLGIFGGDD